MEQIILFFMYLFTTTLGILISLKLLGFKNTGYMGVIIGVANGLNDYFIKEILDSKAHFISGLHLITGIIVVFLLCYCLLKIRSFLGLLIPVLGYAVTALSEIMFLLLMLSLFDKSFIQTTILNIKNQLFIGSIAEIPVIISFLLLHYKFTKFTIFNLQEYLLAKKGN